MGARLGQIVRCKDSGSGAEKFEISPGIESKFRISHGSLPGWVSVPSVQAPIRSSGDGRLLTDINAVSRGHGVKAFSQLGCKIIVLGIKIQRECLVVQTNISERKVDRNVDKSADGIGEIQHLNVETHGSPIPVSCEKAVTPRSKAVS